MHERLDTARPRIRRLPLVRVDRPASLGGHHNVFFRTPDRERAIQGQRTIAALSGSARARHEGVLIIPHAHKPATRRSDPDGSWLRSCRCTSQVVATYLKRGHQSGSPHRRSPSRPGYSGRCGRALANSADSPRCVSRQTAADIFDKLRARQTITATTAAGASSLTSSVKASARQRIPFSEDAACAPA